MSEILKIRLKGEYIRLGQALKAVNLAEDGVDFQRLQEPYPFPGGRFCHTCLDTETNTLYVYGEEAEGRPAYLKVFKSEDEE